MRSVAARVMLLGCAVGALVGVAVALVRMKAGAPVTEPDYTWEEVLDLLRLPEGTKPLDIVLEALQDTIGDGEGVDRAVLDFLSKSVIDAEHKRRRAAPRGEPMTVRLSVAVALVRMKLEARRA